MSLPMKVDLYTRCWNDAHMLGFFFRHYDPLVQRFVVFDDGSTDGSLELLRAHPKVEIRSQLPYSHPDSRVLSSRALMNSCWKESRGAADWVIVTDIDEHLYHPDLPGYLRACHDAGVTLVPALGYQMLAPQFPSPQAHLGSSLTRGAPWVQMSKLNCFQPGAIAETHYAVGRHVAEPQGRLVFPARDELLLLHYKYLGFATVRRRHAQYDTRLKAHDRANRWGHKYAWSDEQLQADWAAMEARAVDVAQPDLRPWTTHPEPRWWEPLRRRAGAAQVAQPAAAAQRTGSMAHDGGEWTG